MQKYIAQLIEDIQEAKRRPHPPKMFLPPELECMRGAEEYLHGEYYEMGQLFGLKKIQFPPIDRLNPKQIEDVTAELELLWEAFNFVPDFPKGLPTKYKYNILVEYLEHKTTYVSEGHNHFEFCTYEPESCPFPEDFCTCKEFDDDDIDMDKYEDDENKLPF
jgi:hypothetical protein